MSESDRVLNAVDLQGLSEILKAAQRNKRFKRLLDDGRIIEGTARAITHEGGGFLASKDDIRDAFLWVTTSGGMDTWWPIPALLKQVNETTMVFD